MRSAKSWISGFLLLLLSAAAAGAPSEPSAVRHDNYLDLRAKLLSRLQSGKKARDAVNKRAGTPVEDQYEIHFEQWDRYWRDHMDARSRIPGKMADMSRYLRMYALQNSDGAAKNALASPGCPNGGMGSWTLIGPSTPAAPVMGRVTAVAIDANNPSTVYAGAALGGLFKTVNNGGWWANRTDGTNHPALGVSSIAVHPNNPSIIYIATSNGVGGVYGFGILKSLDGGMTWNETFTLANHNNQSNYSVVEHARVQKVMLHPQDPETIYALAAHYVFRSSDAGATWQKVLEITVPASNPHGCAYRLVDIDIIEGQNGVADSKVLVNTIRFAWMGIANSPCGTARAYLSTTGGSLNSFTQITSNVLGGDLTDRIGAAVQPGNDTEFYIGYQNLTSNAFTIKKYTISTNSSAHVGNVTANGVFQLGAGYWNLEMNFSPLVPTTLYVAGTTAYRVRLAGGFSAAQLSSYWATSPYGNPLAKTHADVRAMTVVQSGTHDIVLLGTDGGIHKAVLDPNTAYTPATANWQDLTGPGLAINEFYDVNGIESNPDVLVGGTQDNGTFTYVNNNWKQSVNYDGWRGVMNESSGEYFGMSNAGGIKGIPPSLSITSAPAIGSGPVVADPNNPSVIYGGGQSVYKSTSFGASWTTLPSFPGTQNLRVIQVAPSDSNVLYVAREGQTWNASDTSAKLFKSTNGGATWTDVGVNLWALAWAGVSDIAIDPNDASRIWISLSGYWSTSSTSTDGASRVFYSADGGSTFSDFTYNLPAFPTIALVYQSGSDDVLFVGTDVGVFRYNRSLQTWECFSGGLPIVPVAALKINACKNKLRAATGGRGIWEADLPALPAQVVSASATWSGIRYIPNELTIESGVTLTLKGTLNMSRDKRVIVERGGTLIVDGGRITNCCGEMWKGIEVRGTASAAQNFAGAQGKVIVRNNAIIENARDAIVTGGSVNGVFDWSLTGGIVQCSDATFRNNRKSVAFLYYRWVSGTTEKSNLSHFTNCTFETTRLLNDPATLPDAHVSLYEVRDVRFEGCRFRNTAPLSVYGVNRRGYGLASDDAQYFVDDLYGNFIDVNGNRNVIASSAFTGLTYGVRANFTAGVNKKVIVSASDFADVQRGVQIGGSQGSIVTSNSFVPLPNAQTANFPDATWGVRMNGATAFTVDGNSVTGASPAYQNNYGIIIDGGGSSAANLVRGNTLTNLYTGIQAIGNNGTAANGVQFRCNVFKPSMEYQLAVQSTGTLADQGSPGCLLGKTVDNTFFAQSAPAGSQINAPGVSFLYFASGTVPTNIAGPVTVNACLNVAGECAAGSQQMFATRNNH